MNIESQYENSLMKLIQDRLNEKGWKPVDLVKASGVTQPTISKFLKGTKNVGCENIYNILVALDLIKTCADNYNPGIPINIDYLEKIIEMIELVSKELKLKIPPHNKSRLIKLYYKLSIQNNTLIDYEFIKENAMLIYNNK